MRLLGLIIGLLVGAFLGGVFGAFAGAFLGVIAGAMLKFAMVNPNQLPEALDARIQALENRIGHLTRTVILLQERLKKVEATASETAWTDTAAANQPAVSPGPAEVPAAMPPHPIKASVAPPQHSLVTPPTDTDATPITVDQPTVQPLETTASANQIAQPPEPISADTPSIFARLFSGNILAKIGVVLLFFGVASALKLAVQYGLFPVEVRLLIGGAIAVAMIAFGRNRIEQPQHRMFGLALQGGGFAILYLLVYFMLARYQMIGYTTAFVLFMLLGVGCVLLAAAEDGMSLAVLGMSGAFTAPVLASSGSGDHIVLFSYYAILNGFILCVNWFKGWRGLNVCGFIFTFLIGMAWGTQRYQAEHFLSTETFLVLFFLMYSLTPVVFALFQAPGMKGWSDGALVFGTPIAATLSQALLMRPYEYGLAWSTFIAGVYYLLLWAALLRRRDPEMQLMEKSHLGIAIALLTAAIPLAFSVQLSSAIWALEGAVLIWLGITQGRWLARIFGALLQGVSGLYFLSSWIDGKIPQTIPVLNSFYIGALILAASGIVSARLLLREPGRTVDAAENQALSSLLLFWGLLWWFGAGVAEIHQFAARQNQSALLLGFIAGSVFVLELVGHSLTWRGLRMPVLPLTAGIVVAALRHYDETSHVLEGAMLIVFPLALLVHYWALARHEKEAFGLFPGARHLIILWVIIAVATRELAWLSYTLAPANTLWPLLAYGVVPALFVSLTIEAAKKMLWPVAARPDDYLKIGLVPVVILLGLWSLYANFAHPGSGLTLPYVPLLNPFDLVQILALYAILRWARTFPADDGRAQLFPKLVYALGFVWLSMMAARLGHHWAHVPFTFDALMRSLFVQSALSLIWTLAAISLMITATRKFDRSRWFAGFSLLGVVGAKLLFVDLANVGTVAWTASLIGIALLVLAASYFSPAPPKADAGKPAMS